MAVPVCNNVCYILELYEVTNPLNVVCFRLSVLRFLSPWSIVWWRRPHPLLHCAWVDDKLKSSGKYLQALIKQLKHGGFSLTNCQHSSTDSRLSSGHLTVSCPYSLQKWHAVLLSCFVPLASKAAADYENIFRRVFLLQFHPCHVPLFYLLSRHLHQSH